MINQLRLIKTKEEENARKSIEMFGADAVNSNALANWIVTLQAGIRRAHKAGKTDDEIQELLGSAKMGVAVSGGQIDPIQASLAKFKTMNAEEQAEYLDKLRSAAAEEDIMSSPSFFNLLNVPFDR